MNNRQHNKSAINSAEQNKHKAFNRQLDDSERMEAGNSKKLNGPNRPST